MHKIDIKNLKPAKRYAKALLGLHNVDEMLLELKGVQEVFDKNKELKEFVEHPIISVLDKKDVVKQVFKENVSTDTLNFLYVLLDEGRINIFNTILNSLKEEYDALKGIVRANVKSVIEFDNEAKERLKKTLEKKLNTEVNIDYELEPSLMGGFSINIQDKIIDLSIKSKFEQLKKLNKGI